MKANSFYHALKINEEACIGCARCMRSCPTEAIRVFDGVAHISGDRCIDCGECFASCPNAAVYIAQDDFKQLDPYKYKVALLPAVFIGQCPEDISTQRIYNALLEIGFTHVFEVEQVADFMFEKQRDYEKEHADDKPLISSFCPAVVRLIQVKFPSLIPNLILQKQPIDMAAIFCKENLLKEGAKEEEIGLFYITPCAAKIAAVKRPIGEEKSNITGVINMNYLYNLVLKKVKESPKPTEPQELSQVSYCTSKGILWSLSNGEENMAPGRALAVDGIHLVNEFLEKVEDDELSDVDFIELRACDQSCAGGVLLSGNRFLTVERLQKRSAVLNCWELTGKREPLVISEEIKQKMSDNIAVDKVPPRSMLKLDEDIAEAMKKMQRINELRDQLPGVDCTLCGAPSCQAFAEDMVQKEVPISNCVFQNKEIKSLEEIWKKNKTKD